MEFLEITRSKLRRELLKYYFTHPGERFYLRELERLLGFSVANIRRELRKLEKLNLFISKKVGNLSYFSLNKKCPFYTEIKNIVLKTVGLGDVIKTNLHKIKGIKYAFIYGSFAKGDEIKSSDIDLMIIGDISREKVTPKIYQIEKTLGRPINLLSYSIKEIEERVKKKNPFMLRILKNKKIMIMGSEHDLQKLIKR